LKTRVGQAHDGVQVALVQQVLLEPGLDALAEEGAVGQDDGGAAAGLEQADDQGEEEVGGLAGAEVLGKLDSMPSSSMPPKGGLVRTMSTRSIWCS
jgi:hypothetical protein